MTYQETIRLPWWSYAAVWALAALFCFTLGAVSVPMALVAYVVAVVLTGWWLERRSLKLVVDASEFHVGQAVLQRSMITSAQPLQAEQMRAVAGPDADARAVLVLRNVATKTGVKVDLDSIEVPYWLVSSKNPEALAAALSSGS